MPEFLLDQPADAIIQVAYSVPDVEAAISWRMNHLGVEPWDVVDRIGRSGWTYRGQPAEAEFRTAMAYSVQVNFELIRTLDDKPSIYKEAHERSGNGFRDVAKIQPNTRQLAQAYEAKGPAIVCPSPATGGSEIFFIEGEQHAPGYIELNDDSGMTKEIFKSVWLPRSAGTVTGRSATSGKRFRNHGARTAVWPAMNHARIMAFPANASAGDQPRVHGRAAHPQHSGRAVRAGKR